MPFMAKQSKRPQRPAQQITAEKLDALFAQKLPSPAKRHTRLNMPDRAEIEELAKWIEQWRQVYRHGDTLDELREKRKSAKAALGKFAEAASQYQKQIGLPALAERLCAIDAARLAVERTMDAFVPEIAGLQKWRALAPQLLAQLVEVMRPANPRWRLRISHQGPVPRIIAAMVTLLTGEQPTVASVATQLKNVRSTQQQKGAEARRWVEEQRADLTQALAGLRRLQRKN
jgi:hypothetical protein